MKNIFKTLPVILAGASMLFGSALLINQRGQTGVTAGNGDLDFITMEAIPISHVSTSSIDDGDYIPLNYSLSSEITSYGYEITFANFTWPSAKAYSSFHQLMSVYTTSVGGAGYFFCTSSSPTWKFQVGSTQADVGYDPQSYPQKNTITVEVDLSQNKYTVKDTLGKLNANDSYSGDIPTGKDIALIYNAQMDFYGCRIWETKNGTTTDIVDVTPVAYYDSKEDELVMGIYDAITDTGTFAETGRTDDFVSVTYHSEGEVYAREGFANGKVDTTLIDGPEVKGKAFKGWYDQATGGNRVNALSSSAEGIIHLYAQFDDVMHNIIYKSGNTSIEVNGATSFPENDGLDLSGITPKVIPEDMKFVGWYDASEGGNEITEIEGGTENDIVLFAQFAYSEDAFIDDFLESQLCDNGVIAPSKTLWSSLAEQFNNLGSAEKQMFVAGRADQSGSALEQCLARYDYIIAKYGEEQYSDFMNRNPDPLLSAYRFSSNNTQGDYWTVVICLGAISTLVLTCLFVLKNKKKVND